MGGGGLCLGGEGIVDAFDRTRPGALGTGELDFSPERVESITASSHILQHHFKVGHDRFCTNATDDVEGYILLKIHKIRI